MTRCLMKDKGGWMEKMNLPYLYDGGYMTIEDVDALIMRLNRNSMIAPPSFSCKVTNATNRGSRSERV